MESKSLTFSIHSALKIPLRHLKAAEACPEGGKRKEDKPAFYPFDKVISYHNVSLAHFEA